MRDAKTTDAKKQTDIEIVGNRTESRMASSSSSQILRVDGKIAFNDDITRYEFYKYKPYNTNTYSYNDSIKFIIANQDLYTYTQDSFIRIEGRIVNGDANSVSKFVNFGPALLWEAITLKIGEFEIARVRDPGRTALIKGYASLTEGEMKNHCDAGWSIGEDRDFVNGENEFEVNIPLSLLLGFAEDYHAVILNAKLDLEVVRKRSDDDALVTTATAADAVAKDGKVEITAIEWHVPHVNVSDARRVQLLRQLQTPKQIYYRAWNLFEFPNLPVTTKHYWSLATNMSRPRYVILAFQTNRASTQKNDSSIFDQANMRFARLLLNTQSYPQERIEVNFAEKKDLMLYQMYKNFQRVYYNDFKNGAAFDLKQFRGICPIWIFDCSKQAESVKTGPVDIMIEMETWRNFPEKTNAYSLIIDDRAYHYVPLTSEAREIPL